MKKALAIAFIVILSVGVLLVVGCGGTETTETGEEVIKDVPEPASEGIYGEYEQTDGDKTISLYQDGTFTTGSGDEGAFEVKGNSVEMTFQNGTTSTETWSVMISGGEIAAIVSPDGDQYNKK
jgi:hypothetical protein